MSIYRGHRFPTMWTNIPRLLWILTLAAALLVPAGGPARCAAQRAVSQDVINTLISDLPILPPEKADKKFESSLQISGLPVEKFLIMMSRPEFLDINMVIATNSSSLQNPVEIYLNDITMGEAFNLVLQLNDLKAIRFNSKTLIITDKNDTKTFGIKRRKMFTLHYTTTEKVIDFIKDNKQLSDLISTDSLIANEEQNRILAVDTEDNLRLLSYVIDLLDAKPNKIQATIRLSNIDKDKFVSALQEMPPEIKDRFDADEIHYSEAGHSLIVYDTPENIEFLRKLIKQIDIPPKQVLCDIALMEVSSTLTRNLGIELNNSSFSVNSLDTLLSLGRLKRALQGQNPSAVTISYLLQKNGGRTLISPKIRVLDGETANINIGEIRNVRVQSTEFVSNTQNTTQQTTYNTQEVPIGVTLNVTPTVHNDDTVTLDLTISDENIISIQDYGVDRTTRNSQTKLRVRNGETVILGGFINNNRTYDDTPVPFIGRLPLIGKLFRAGKRSKINTELVFLITPYILDVSKKGDSSVTPKQIGLDKKTLADLKPSKELKQEKSRSRVVRWVETDKTRTKLVYDEKGDIIYRKTWDKETGEPVEENESAPAAGAAATSSATRAKPEAAEKKAEAAPGPAPSVRAVESESGTGASPAEQAAKKQSAPDSTPKTSGKDGEWYDLLEALDEKLLDTI